MKKVMKSVKKFFKSKPGKISLRVGLIVVILAAVGSGLYFGKSYFVAAVVNGKPITRLAVVSELEKQDGKTVLDSLIEKELILQEAKKNNVSVTDAQVATEIGSITTLLKQQNTTLDAALVSKGMTMADLKDQIIIQKSVEAILGPKIQISDAEVKDYFDQNLQYFKDNISKTVTLEQATSQIKDQLFQQKLSTQYSTWIADLKAKAKIMQFVSY
jgi:parvulin-like peptidyl-prolyl isomerase